MKAYKLTISSPDGSIFEGEVLRIILRGANGDLAVMAGHIPFITSVSPCDVRVLLEDETEKIGYADGGLLTVSEEKAILLSSSFIWKSDE